MCFIQNLNAKTNVANTDCNNSFCLFLLRPGNLKYFKSECHTLIASCLSEISWLWKCTWLCVTTSWTTTMCPRRCWPCTCRASLTPLLPSTSRPATTSGSTTARQQRYTHTRSCFMKNLSQKYLRNWWLKVFSLSMFVAISPCTNRLALKSKKQQRNHRCLNREINSSQYCNC